ncbi:MAG TPA: GGDEF domain-containing protein [Acidimicrobiia bacterium]|nr:GGDEF domain-containing protein [Acidimicrobiia bacterium]
MNPLDRIEAAQARSLERLRQDGPDRSLLVQLVEASCLLELAKLDATRLDPSTYLQLAVDVVAQMYPVVGCAATVLDGARTLEVHAGKMTDDVLRVPLVVREKTIGVLVTGRLTSDLGSPADFLTRAADQIARGISIAFDAERLRRDAATATAARIASELSPEDVVDGLEELALALASFPSVIAAELVLDHAAIGPPLHLRAGYWDDDGRAHSIGSSAIDLGPTGRLAVRLRSNDEQSPDEGGVDAVLAGLAGSLERLLHTQRLVEDAETDMLSGLGNRRRLERALAHALSRAERYGEHVAVMLIDLDRFKAVNDILGHETGDAVIVACACAMRERVRAYDETIRLGGDEFVVVAPVPDVLDALELADAVRLEIAQRCGAVLPPDWALSATIGVALYPDAGTNQETLLRAADEALYRAKGDGRDTVAVAQLTSPDPPRGA